MTEQQSSLKIAQILTGVEKVNKEVIEGMTGIQAYLKCRWSRVNRSMLGGWRFNNNYVIAGLSGHGKSWILNLLLQDFCDRELNKAYTRDYKILHFGLEMSMTDEILRQVSTRTKISYENLISANSPLTSIEYELVKNSLEKIKEMPIWIVEEPGTIQQVYNTIEKFHSRFPDSQFIITLDHSLLLNNTGGDELKLIAETAKMFMLIRKRFGSMNILLAQLNTNIEKDERRTTVPSKKFLNYPQKSDLHGSQGLFHAADFVVVVHQPALLNLELYGTANHPTTDLVAWHLIKARKGTPKYIRLRQQLNQGNIIEWME